MPRGIGSEVRAGSDYTGKSQVCDSAGNCHPTASGDLSAFAPGLLVRANLLGLSDSQKADLVEYLKSLGGATSP